MDTITFIVSLVLPPTFVDERRRRRLHLLFSFLLF